MKDLKEGGYTPLRTEVSAGSNSHSPSPTVSNNVRQALARLLELDDHLLEGTLREVRQARPKVWKKATSPAGNASMGQAQGLVRSATQARIGDDETSTCAGDSPRDHVPHGSLDHHVIEEAPIVQFTSTLYFCLEDEGAMSIDIMRIGDLSKVSEVSFRTRDKSAKAGAVYDATEERVVFQPGEELQTVNVPLLDTAEWNTTVEFAIELHPGSGLKNCVLGRYLKQSKVKIIDNDCFPANEVRDIVSQRKLAEHPWTIFMQYVFFNFANPVVRLRSLKFMLVDVFHSVYNLLRLFINVYLIDYVLKKHHQEEDLWFTKKRDTELFLLVLVQIVPFFLLHVLDFLRASYWGVGGTSRLTLQCSILRKFLNYDSEARLNIQAGNLIMAMTRDTTSLVADGYINCLAIFRECCDLALMLAYQCTAPRIFNRPFSIAGFCPMIFFPMAMFPFLMLRDRTTSGLLHSKNHQQNELVDSVEETVNLYRLIADYNQREKFTKRFEKFAKDFNAANKQANVVLKNNLYFAKWLRQMMICSFFIMGGLKVVHGTLSLGMYLASISVIKKIGDAWQSIYRILLEITTVFPPLINITEAMDMHTDVELKRHLMRARRRNTKMALETLRTNPPPGADVRYIVDQMSIIFHNIHFEVHTKHGPDLPPRVTKLNGNGLLEVRQGQYVALVGPSGGGKSLLLNIIGGNFLPDVGGINSQGIFLVPSHLRVLQVTKPLFIESTLLENLTFGVSDGDPDGQTDRVINICRKIGISDDIIKHIEMQDINSWADVFSHSECQLLSIARALVSNPEVLCMHKPGQGADDSTSEVIAGTLKEFCQRRGVCQSGPLNMRRPRTAILTTASVVFLEAADKVYDCTQDKGIQLVNPKALNLIGKKQGIRGAASTLSTKELQELGSRVGDEDSPSASVTIQDRRPSKGTILKHSELFEEAIEERSHMAEVLIKAAKLPRVG